MGTALSSEQARLLSRYADEVIVGDPFSSNDDVQEGRVFVYHGSAAGPAATPT